MNKGKKVCDCLKEIRKNIADESNLELNQVECQFKGNCNGTCPKCEEELEKINKNLDHKKLVALLGTLSLATTLVGCSFTDNKDNIDNIAGLIAQELPTNTILEDNSLSGDIEYVGPLNSNDINN